jgi:hypothetical protein
VASNRRRRVAPSRESSRARSPTRRLRKSYEIEVVNTPAESALETQDVLRAGRGASRTIKTDT